MRLASRDVRSHLTVKHFDVGLNLDTKSLSKLERELVRFMGAASGALNPHVDSGTG
jgi:hypothetical protein